MVDNLKVGSARVFTIKYRAHPEHEPLYLDLGVVGAPDWALGDVTKIEAPSRDQYNQWEPIDAFQVSADRPSIDMQVYKTAQRSRLLEFAKTRCALDIQVHFGICEDPTDFNGGWQKVTVLPDSRLTNYSSSELGSLQGDGQAQIIEEASVSAERIFDILRMSYRFVAQAEVGERVIAISVCDTINCGDCTGIDASDGCQAVFALSSGFGSSPGVFPQLIITTDQYGVKAIIERWITTGSLAQALSDGTCVGANYVAIGQTGLELHYAPIDDILLEQETWTEVTTGFVAAKGPNAIWNYSPFLSFICGNGGYIYQMKDPADGVLVLNAGAATVQNLNDIEGWDGETVAAVGAAGVVVYTTDGTNFNLTTANPNNAAANNAVAFRDSDEIWVGNDAGEVYYTLDFGITWTEKSIPGAMTSITKIVWANKTVGFIGGNAGANGKILRTIDGGYSWYVVPEGGTAIPLVDAIDDMAVCVNEPNKLFVGGLADNAGDGFIIKGSD